MHLLRDGSVQPPSRRDCDPSLKNMAQWSNSIELFASGQDFHRAALCLHTYAGYTMAEILYGEGRECADCL